LRSANEIQDEQEGFNSRSKDGWNICTFVAGDMEGLDA